MADHGVIQLNNPSGPPRQGGGGPPGGRMIPPPPQHHGGQGHAAARPIIMNANPGQRQPNGQPQQNMQQNRMMMPGNHGQQQFPSLAQERQAMGMAMLPPQPPRNIVPRALLEGPVVQISDIRKEPGRLTELEARDELSDFVIFRFERADAAAHYDADGEIVEPTWANVVRTEVRGLTKKEAARQVRMLTVDHRPFGDKKASLTDAQQRQLEKVLEELEMREGDPRYHHVLVQIDRKLRDKKVRYKSKDRGDNRRHADKKSGEKNRRYSENRGRRETVDFVDILGRRRSMVRETKKKVQETVSITAYYKRCPKPDVDPMTMLYQRNEDNAGQLEPPHPQHTFAPLQMQQHQPPMHNHQPQIPMGMSMGMPMSMGMGMGMGPQQGTKMMNPNQNKMGNTQPNNKLNGGRPNIQVLPNRGNNNNMPRKKSPAPNRRQPRSPTSSQESAYSDTDSSSDQDSVLTPNSSRSSHSHHKPRRLSSPTKQRRSDRYLESPSHFGIPPRTVTPHKQRRHEEHRISDETMFPPPVRRALPPLAPLAPAPPRFGVDLEELKASAYAAGRADERGDLRERVQMARPVPRVVQNARRSLDGDMMVVEEEDLLPYPPSPPMGGRMPLHPRVVQGRPSVRLVRPAEVGLDEDVIDSLERFRIEDEGMRGRYREERGERYTDDYFDDVILRSERRRIDEARLRDEEIAIVRERERSDRARGFLRRADSEVLYERDRADPSNPFVPRPGMTRRATVGYGVRGEYSI